MSPVLLVQMAYPEAKYHKFSIKPPSLLNLPLYIVITPLSPTALISKRRMYFLITTLKLHVEWSDTEFIHKLEA